MGRAQSRVHYICVGSDRICRVGERRRLLGSEQHAAGSQSKDHGRRLADHRRRARRTGEQRVALHVQSAGRVPQRRERVFGFDDLSVQGVRGNPLELWIRCKSFETSGRSILHGHELGGVGPHARRGECSKKRRADKATPHLHEIWNVRHDWSSARGRL